jgi:hypothetical protein
MINITDPRQTQLFDPFEHLFSPLAYKTIQNGWQGVFRHVILELLPAQILAGEFHPAMGRPTKELYSVAGLTFIMEFQDWTKEEAAQAYMFHSDLWYALNLEPGWHSMCVRTLERYQEIFRENELAQSVMHDVTLRLVEVLELDISKQRLDSTHVFSDMATFGRTRLMGVTIKRFLTQVKRHDRKVYDALPEQLLARYRPSEHQLFASAMKDKEHRKLARQQVAEDMHALIERFGGDKRFNHRGTFKALCLVFEQQCEVVEKKVTVKAKTGGNVIQNPSDLDATYDGHKGPGYQAQLSETCSEQNEVQLVTSAIAQTASASDADAPEEVREDLKQSALLPGEILADTLYGSDENLQASAADGVELVAPVPGKTPSAAIMNIGDFDVDEETETVVACPAGHAPQTSMHNPETAQTRTQMAAGTCDACEQKERCPMNQTRNGCHLEHTSKERRLDQRRRNETTDAFRKHYNKRAGIEATNSGIKRRTGMARLRVRGKKSVFHAIIMKVAGWNILQAARSEKMRGYVRGEMGKTKQGGQEVLALRGLMGCWRILAGFLPHKTAFCMRNLDANQRATRHRRLCAV